MFAPVAKPLSHRESTSRERNTLAPARRSHKFSMDAVLPKKLNKHLVYQKPKDVSHSSTMGVYLTDPRTTIQGCSDLKGEEAGETLSSVFLPLGASRHTCVRGLEARHSGELGLLWCISNRQ